MDDAAVRLARDSLDSMRAALGPLAVLDDARRRMQWFTEVLRGLAPGVGDSSPFAPDDLLWIPSSVPGSVLAGIPHPQRGVSVAYSWMHGVEAVRVKCKWGGTKGLPNQQAMWLDARVVPHGLLPAMEVLQQAVIPCWGTASVWQWRVRVDDAVEFVKSRVPAEHKGLVSLAVVATAVWALGLGEPRRWCRETAKGMALPLSLAPVHVHDPHEWRLQAEWCPAAVGHDKFKRAVSCQGWPVDLLTAAYRVHVKAKREFGWRVRFADGLPLVGAAREYATRVVSTEAPWAFGPAARAASKVFGPLRKGASTSLQLYDLGGVMRCSTAMALAGPEDNNCAAFAWLLVAALVCEGVLDANAVGGSAATCWADVSVPVPPEVDGGDTVGDTVGDTDDDASVPASVPGPVLDPARCGLSALDTMLCLAADTTQVMLPREQNEPSTACEGAVVFSFHPHDCDLGRAEGCLNRVPEWDGTCVEDCAPGVLLSMILAQGEPSLGTPPRQAANLCAMACMFMDPAINRRWMFGNCLARRELQTVLAADLRVLLGFVDQKASGGAGASDVVGDAFVSVRDSLLQSLDGWCVGSEGWLRRASTAMWWWLLAKCTRADTALRFCVAAAAELSYRWPAEEPLLLWAAFVQTTRLPLHGAGSSGLWGQATAPTALPKLVTASRMSVHPVWSCCEPCIRIGHTVVRLDAIDPATLNPIVTLIDESANEDVRAWLNYQVEKHDAGDGGRAAAAPDMAPLAFHADWTHTDTVMRFAAQLAPREAESRAQPASWMRIGADACANYAALTAACAAVVDAVACQDPHIAAMTSLLLSPTALVHALIGRMVQRVGVTGGSGTDGAGAGAGGAGAGAGAGAGSSGGAGAAGAAAYSL